MADMVHQLAATAKMEDSHGDNVMVGGIALDRLENACQVPLRGDFDMLNTYSGIVVASIAIAASAHAAVVTDQLVFNYDGDSQAATTWTSSTPGSDTSRTWTATGSVTLGPSGSTLTNITTAYDLSGGGFTGTAFDGLGNDASFEVWIKPDSLTGGQQLIIETGGSSKGLSLSLWDNELRFAIKSANGGDNPLDANIIKRTLSAADITDFLQIVVTIAPNPVGSTLYVNPASSSDPSSPAGTGGATIFDGADGAGLGILSGSIGGSTGSSGPAPWNNASFTTFDGKVGVFRVYNDVLSGSEVAENFSSIAIPEPGSLALVGLVGLGLVRRRRAYPPRVRRD